MKQFNHEYSIRIICAEKIRAINHETLKIFKQIFLEIQVAVFIGDAIYCSVKLFQDPRSAGNKICFEHRRNKFKEK